MDAITKSIAQMDELLMSYTEDKARSYTPNVSLSAMIDYWTEKTASIIARSTNVRAS